MIYVYNCGELFQAFKHLETRSLSCFIGCQVDFSNASSISFHPEGNRSNKTLKGRRMSLGGIWWNDILDGYEAIFHFLRALMGSRHHGAQKCENNSLGLWSHEVRQSWTGILALAAELKDEHPEAERIQWSPGKEWFQWFQWFQRMVELCWTLLNAGGFIDSWVKYMAHWSNYLFLASFRGLGIWAAWASKPSRWTCWGAQLQM